MAGKDVYMDIPKVHDIAKTFHTFNEILTVVVKVLEGIINTLKATIFVGLVGGYAVIQYLEQIKPEIEKVAEHCEELYSDLEKSVTAYENGDQEGATRFY